MTAHTNNVQVHHLAFGVDKAILRNVILQQAGSLQKALIELVMNELDANATDVEITISADLKRVIVSGNGVGFTSLPDIEKHFGTFGFAHDSEEELAVGRRYGRYGLGRGQIFAFGASTWSTNEFSMAVDFKSWDPKKEDLPYVVQVFPAVQHRGCKIDIALYKVMSLWERNNLESELKRMLRYTPQTIRLNGQIINTAPEQVSWTASNEHLRFKASSGTGGLTLYNEGVLVCTLRHSLFGISGDLTSFGKAFDVNMARNDIQQSTCQLWPTIKPFLTPFVEKKRRSALTDEDREHMLRSFITGQMPFETLSNVKLFRMISGNYVTLKTMLSHAKGLVTLAPAAFSNVGTKLHHFKRAAVVSPALPNTLGYETLPAFFAALSQALLSEAGSSTPSVTRHELRQFAGELSRAKVLDFDTLAHEFEHSHDVIDKASLSPLDKCKFIALEHMNDRIAREITKCQPRQFNIGISDVAMAWTDGRSCVVLKQEIFKTALSKGMGPLLDVAALFVHEYLHDGNSGLDHSHDLDFYMGFHDKTFVNHSMLLDIAQKTFLKYCRERRKAGLGVLATELSSMLGYFGELLVGEMNGISSDDQACEHAA